MKRVSVILLDYIKNAFWAAAIGTLVAIAAAIAQGESILRPSDAGAYALIGLACGTCSKAAIEGAFFLFGASRLLAYVLNASVIAIVILVLVRVFFDGWAGLDPWVVLLVFALPEAASVLLVRG